VPADCPRAPAVTARARRGRAPQIARVPTDPDLPAPDPAPQSGPDVPPARPLGEGFDEPRVPRGCNPLVFGVVMATIQLAATVYFMRTC
jgi:hypothetical protein